MEKLHVWHGTNQEFDSFAAPSLGLNTCNQASAQAFFFSVRPDTAWEYALKAARTLVPDHHEHQERVADILKQAERAGAKGQFDRMEQLYMQAEEIETAAINAEPSGQRLLHCTVHILNPMYIDGADRRVVVDLAMVLADAKKSGHDAVIIQGISDTPSGATDPDDHIAVFDAADISIDQIYLSLEEAEAVDRVREPEMDF